MRRSTVLNLPLQLGFHGQSYSIKSDKNFNLKKIFIKNFKKIDNFKILLTSSLVKRLLCPN